MNNEFIRDDNPVAGSCAVLIIVKMEANQRVVYGVNVGDSLAYIDRKGFAQELTHKHHVENDEERKRVNTEENNIWEG